MQGVLFYCHYNMAMSLTGIKSYEGLGLGKNKDISLKDEFRDEIRIRLEVRRPSQELMIHVLGYHESREICVRWVAKEIIIMPRAISHDPGLHGFEELRRRLT